MPPEQNPGVLLGTILGTLARAGRDKVTLVGRFTDASHATGTFRDVLDLKGGANSHCDTGKVKFTVAHT